MPFSASIEMIIWFVSFLLLMYVTLANIEPLLHPWNKSHLIMVSDPFKVLLHVVCKYFVEDICVCVQQGYGPVVFFFHVRVMLAS